MSDETDDFRDEVENASLDHPDPWDPDPGDYLIATVDHYDRAQTNFGKNYVCNAVNEDTGELVAVWLSYTVLLEQFQDKKPEPGERIGLKYHGTHPEKDYRLYTLKVDREGPDAVPDFDDSPPPADAPAVKASGEETAEAVQEQRTGEQETGDGESSGPSGEYGEDFGEDDDIPF
jgi:hypothetical protein